MVAADRDAQMQFQPVDAGRFLQFGGEIAVGGDDVDREVVIDLDLPSFGAQLRHHLENDRQPG